MGTKMMKRMNYNPHFERVGCKQRTQFIKGKREAALSQTRQERFLSSDICDSCANHGAIWREGIKMHICDDCMNDLGELMRLVER